MTTAIPSWVAVVGDYLHVAGLALAILLPLLRAGVRRIRAASQCFITRYVVHDVAAGISLPSFVALCLTTVAPQLLTLVDKHSLTLAGALGVVFILSELFGVEH
jgi:hypothetical protein